MTVKTWVDLNYERYKQACNRITGYDELAEELCHYILTEFLSRSDADAIVQSGGAFFYCLRMTTNNWNSVTSPFYRIYRQPKIGIDKIPEPMQEEPDDNEPDIDELAERVSEQLKQLGWYEQNLLQAYVEHGGNASSLSKQTGIPRTSISLTIKKVKTFVNKRIK